MLLADFKTESGETQEFDVHELGFDSIPSSFQKDGKTWNRVWGDGSIVIPYRFSDPRHKFGMNKFGPTGKKNFY